MANFNINIAGRSNSAHSQSTPTSKIFGTFLFSIFLIVGGGLSYVIGSNFIAALATRSWTPIDCTITRATIDQKPPYSFDVEYDYQINSQPYTGITYSTGYTGSGDYYDAQKLLDRYPAGSHATCLVNPHDPHQANLQSPSLLAGLAIFFSLPFFTIGLAGIFFTWHPARQSAANLTEQHQRLVGTIFLGFFFIAGAAVQIYLIPLLIHGHAAQSWPRAPARIASASVVSHTSSGSHGSSTTYSVGVLFHYTFDGKRFGSSRYTLAKSSDSDYDGKQEIVNSLLQNKNTICFVNPADPADAVLDRSYAGTASIAALISFVFMLVGGGGIFLVQKQAIDKNRAKLKHHLASARNAPLELRPAISPAMKFAFISAMMLIWNGVVAALLMALVPELMAGHAPMWTAVVAALLAACGLGLLILSILSIRPMLLPMPHLTLKHHPITPGQESQIHWNWTGDASRFIALKMSIAVYDTAINQHDTMALRGTTSLRGQTPFWKADLLDATNPAEISTGQLNFTIPAEPMIAQRQKTIVCAILLDAQTNSTTLKLEFPMDLATLST